MGKPWNPKDPPMTLNESEWLLSLEADKKQRKQESKGMGLAWVGILCGLGLVAAVGYLVLFLLGIVAKPFL